jgi:hypothetical protein
MHPDVNGDETLTYVRSEEEEEEPAVEETHGELRQEPARKVPVDEATILSPAAPLEELPTVCYFWSRCESGILRRPRPETHL